MAFPGGKGKSFQQIINIMPPHKLYIEPFLGGGAVVKNKKPAQRTIVSDLNKDVLDDLNCDIANMTKMNLDALELLDKTTIDRQTLVYLDPPYLPSTRKQTKIYRHEYPETSHVKLLEKVNTLNCMVVISGYESSLYDEMLKGWNSRKFSTQTQNGKRIECLWFNYAPPIELHDPRYLGNNFRERQAIKRRQARLRSKIEKMDATERSELISWINGQYAA